MTLPKAVGDCSVCPRLCRDVCPVAVHSFRDDFIPSEKMRSVAAALGHAAGVVDPMRLLACTDCGACSAHCLLSIPVAPWLDHARLTIGEEVQAAPPAPAAEAVDSRDLPENARFLPTCTPTQGQPSDRAEHLAPTGHDESQPAGRRCAPAVPEGHDAVPPAHIAAPLLGNTCCGERLDPRVGDPGLRKRMAEGMLWHLPDGAVIAVHNARCAAHLQAVAGDRLRVLAVVGDSADASDNEPAGAP